MAPFPAPLPLPFLRASVSRLLPRLLGPASAAAAAMSTAKTLKSVDYEVFGRVQGVCFRMMKKMRQTGLMICPGHTASKCLSLDLNS